MNLKGGNYFYLFVKLAEIRITNKKYKYDFRKGDDSFVFCFLISNLDLSKKKKKNLEEKKNLFFLLFINKITKPITRHVFWFHVSNKFFSPINNKKIEINTIL